MSEEIKQAVENGLKAVDVKLTAAIEKYEGQIKETGKVSDEAKAAVKALSEEHKKLSATVLDMAQKLDGAAKAKAPATKGAAKATTKAAGTKASTGKAAATKTTGAKKPAAKTAKKAIPASDEAPFDD